MKRRQFITLIGGAVVAWPRAGQAQQAGKLPTIGFLGASSQSGWSSWTGAFVTRLRELGWIEGHTVAIEYRWAEGRNERFVEFAAEFVRLKVDVIVTAGVAGVAVKQETSTIPIVLGVANDPVRDGLVMSLVRPGGNVTGLSVQQTDSAGKRLELLRQIVPSLRRLGILANAGYPASMLEVGEVEATVRPLGIETTRMEIRRAEDIAPAFEALDSGVEALYVAADALTISNQSRISSLALSARLPSISPLRTDAEVGGLISYGANVPDLFRRAGDLVDKVLHGTKPSDLPIEQPTKFELVINLKTAKALGLTIPPGVLAIADEAIE
jgi:putative ABC transport system substrate-binding protein